MFEAYQRRVLAYVLRRVASSEDAEDVAAETFVVGWRRLSDVPSDAELPWLLGVARRLIANHRRGTERRARLSLRLREPGMARTLEAPGSPALDALARLRPDDQELLRLLAWDGLTQAEAGLVLGISANAVGIRVHRARRRFREALAGLEPENAKGSGLSRTSPQSNGRPPGRPQREVVR